jgi:hypothetical protein
MDKLNSVGHVLIALLTPWSFVVKSSHAANAFSYVMTTLELRRQQACYVSLTHITRKFDQLVIFLLCAGSVIRSDLSWRAVHKQVCWARGVKHVAIPLGLRPDSSQNCDSAR